MQNVTAGRVSFLNKAERLAQLIPLKLICGFFWMNGLIQKNLISVVRCFRLACRVRLC